MCTRPTFPKHCFASGLRTIVFISLNKRRKANNEAHCIHLSKLADLETILHKYYTITWRITEESLQLIKANAGGSISSYCLHRVAFVACVYGPAKYV